MVNDGANHRATGRHLRSFDHSDRLHIAFVGFAENDQGLTHIVGNVEFLTVRIHGHRAGPIQLRLRALNDADRRRVAIGVEFEDGDRRRFKSTAAGGAIVADVSPVVNEQQLIFCIDRNAVSISFESRVGLSLTK